jgi:nondiscriminating glutamyl-tRNA synthetase
METTDKKIRVRFAPSPTGYVHIGSLRTALFTFLFARHSQGVNILRIEDTDQNRYVEGALENMLKVFKNMGIEFDEGYYLDAENHVQEKGPFGPYLQSKRLDLYQKYAKQLVEQKNAYYCFCSEQRLEEVHKEQVALKKPPMYDRHCRNLSQEEITTNMEVFKAEGKNPVIRQAIPESGQTIINDIIFDKIVYENKVLDDQVILKSDGFPTYHLAVVVDDHFMEISHVTRGVEWIPSTPKHILLYQAFGWQAPQFAHFPNILNADGSKLSKRQGDVAVEDFLKKGYLKEALLNFIAFLGWNPKTEKEIFSLEELIAEFDLKNVNKAGAVFDVNKLDWINGLYIRQMSIEDLTDALLPYWKESGIDTEKYKKEYFEAITSLERERLKKLSEIGERTKYFFETPQYDGLLLVWKKSDTTDAKKKLGELHSFYTSLSDDDFTKEILEAKTKEFITNNSFDNGSVLWPLRVALTGMEKSPGPFEVASTIALGLGKLEVLARIKTAAEKL